MTVLKVDGKKVTRLNDIEVGALPEAVAFTPDGKYIYVGNYMDKDFSILRVDDTKVTDTDTPELACWFAGRKAAYVLEDNCFCISDLLRHQLAVRESGRFQRENVRSFGGDGSEADRKCR